MPNSYNILVLIKVLHTVIWVIMVAGILYIVYCGIYDVIGTPLYLAIGLLVLEIITLAINNWSCPLTLVAKNYQPNWKPGDDIYLPKWLAINNKLIFGVLLSIGLALVFYQMLT
jgi:hypothetical protein